MYNRAVSSNPVSPHNSKSNFNVPAPDTESESRKPFTEGWKHGTQIGKEARDSPLMCVCVATIERCHH